MTVKTEGKHPGEGCQSLASGDRSVDTLTVASGQNIVAGEVCAILLAAAAAADGGNTGDGTIGAITIGADAQVGDYVLELTGTGPGVAAAGTGAAVAGNTGDGTITAAPATGANAKVGTYMITCIGGDTDAGEFQVEDPDGIVLGVAVVGSAFSTGTHVTFTIADGATDFDEGDAFTITVAAANSGTFTLKTPDGIDLDTGTVAVAYTSDHLNFTLADGATDFIVGDTFTLTVSEGSVETLDPDEDDGAQVAACIAWDNYDASSAAMSGAFVVRDAVYRTDALTWSHSGITAAEKAVATAQLKERGIILR